jgi:cyanophycinase
MKTAFLYALAISVLGCGEPNVVPSDAAINDADSSPPSPPSGLTRWLTGNAADRVTTSRAGLILMGGSTDVDAAFEWQRDRIGGGDVVILRASGADGYNAYLFTDIGGVDSVETLLVDKRALATEPYVKWTLDHAEAIFLAGGDQSVYVEAWDNSPVADTLAAAWSRGAVIGGTSAGCAFVAGFVYSASVGSVLSSEALANPYDTRITLVRDVVAISPLANVVTDTHFAARDRMGRMLAFAARTIAEGWTTTPLALGVDERTALVIDETGAGTVMGTNAVYVLAPQQAPSQCTPNQPLTWANVPLYELHSGDTIALPSGATTITASTLSAANGSLTPANPY